MSLVVVVLALMLLALITQAGVVALQRAYPAQGRRIEVAGAALNVLDIGPRDTAAPPIVMIHGASSNLETMRRPLGDLLARNHRVILIANAIFVVHSWAGALGARMALDHPERVAGLVMLAPVAYPWRGGVGWYNTLVTTPVIGPLLAYTITLPLGYFLTGSGARSVFWPQIMPDGFVEDTATPLLLRPSEFLANAWDLVTLKAAVVEQAPRYGDIKAPTVVIAGDADDTVWPNIHSRPFAATVPNAKLIILPGVGHMVMDAAPDLVIREIDSMIGAIARSTAAAE